MNQKIFRLSATQCVSFEGCKLKSPVAVENGPSFRYISTLSNPIAART